MLTSLILLELLVFFQSVSSTINNESVIEPIVQTEWATFKGMRQNVLGRDIDTFLGIRFAKAPIGELRFKRPVKPDKYENEVYDATHYGFGCAQLSYAGHNYSLMSEDCLFLNIWRPSPGNSIQHLKPVMFFVYGGGFYKGSANSNTRPGEYLSSLADIIVVTTDYRLGFLGYSYGGSDEMPGNMGNYDVLMALEWVHDNIERFGGDPNRVTVSGDCGGSMTVSSFLISPIVSPKLFDQLYLTGGITSPPTAMEDKHISLKKSKLVAKIVGCDDGSNSNDTEPMSEKTIDCLRGVNYTDLDEAMHDPEVTALLLWSANPPFLPIWGTDLVPEKPDILVQRGLPHRKVHMLIGNEQDENDQASGFVPQNKREAYDYLYNMTEWQRKELSTVADFNRIFKYYFNSVGDTDVFKLNGTLGQFITDFCYYCPFLLYAEKWTQHGQIIHAYLNEYVMDMYPRAERPYGPFHGDDVFLILGRAFADYNLCSDKDREVTRKMISVISDFLWRRKLHWPPMLTRKDGHVLPIRWIVDEKMDPRQIRVDPKDKICHAWGKVEGLKFSF